MKRLYILIPKLKDAMDIIRSFQAMGVRNDNVHVLGKDENQLTLMTVPKAGILYTTDILHALIRGLVVGTIAGFLVGLIVFNFPPEGMVLSARMLAGLTIFGAVFGAWVSTLIGISIPNPMVEKFDRAVEAGSILMLVDILNGQQKEIIGFMKTKHPESTVHEPDTFEM